MEVSASWRVRRSLWIWLFSSLRMFSDDFIYSFSVVDVGVV